MAYTMAYTMALIPWRIPWNIPWHTRGHIPWCVARPKKPKMQVNNSEMHIYRSELPAARYALSLSLSLIHTHTKTHAHTHTQTHTLTFTHTHTVGLIIEGLSMVNHHKCLSSLFGGKCTS